METRIGAAVPASQKKKADGWHAAGFEKWRTESPGTGYTMPDGMQVRAMQPNGSDGLRASFENGKGGPVTPDGKVPQPPRRLSRAERLKYVRDRTHVDQTR